MSLFIANYRRELRMGENIRKKGKIEKVTEFVENKEGVGRGKSSIEESTGGHEDASK